jgi:DNA-binding NarL/FixJ family response regulator
VDDHEVVRMGLRAALELEGDLEIVADLGNARVAVREAEIRRPDVVLMDVRMPDMDGIEACRAIRDLVPDAKVLMLTSYSDEKAVFASIMAGASGYLLKNTSRSDLISAVRAVAKGESLLDPAVTARVLQRLKDLSERQEAHEVAMLSEREKEVLSRVAHGLTNKEIAAVLFISENTARNHVSRILDKLGLSRRSEAATFAAQHNLLDFDRKE